MPFLRIWFATRFQRHHPAAIENIRSRQLVSYPCILLSMVRVMLALELGLGECSLIMSEGGGGVEVAEGALRFSNTDEGS